jgi:hypothetical protein
MVCDDFFSEVYIIPPGGHINWLWDSHLVEYSDCNGLCTCYKKVSPKPGRYRASFDVWSFYTCSDTPDGCIDSNEEYIYNAEPAGDDESYVVEFEIPTEETQIDIVIDQTGWNSIESILDWNSEACAKVEDKATSCGTTVKVDACGLSIDDLVGDPFDPWDLADCAGRRVEYMYCVADLSCDDFVNWLSGNAPEHCAELAAETDQICAAYQWAM